MTDLEIRSTGLDKIVKAHAAMESQMIHTSLNDKKRKELVARLRTVKDVNDQAARLNMTYESHNARQQDKVRISCTVETMRVHETSRIPLDQMA